jgi:hypothetical protein
VGGREIEGIREREERGESLRKGDGEKGKERVPLRKTCKNESERLGIKVRLNFKVNDYVNLIVW